MTSAQSWSRRHHLSWADVIHADFQRVISRYIHNISTCLSSKSQRGIRTISIQKSKLKYAYLPSKIVAVWIDRFCVRYDWWRRLQPTSSVSSVCKRGHWGLVITHLKQCTQFNLGNVKTISEFSILSESWDRAGGNKANLRDLKAATGL